MSDLHLQSQTTKKFDIPLNHLEYSYVEKCTSVKELEKILRVLRSGDEGRYPDLETFTEKRLEILCPKSRVLRKDAPISRPGDLSSGDWKAIEQDLKDWSNDMHARDNVKSVKTKKVQNDIYEGDENLPPVRSSNVTLEGKKKKENNSAKNKKKRAMPRDYNEWDKVDVDEELKKMDEGEGKRMTTSKVSEKFITDKIDCTGMSAEEKERKANREKDKGNEAYRSGDFEESVTYYSRSISLLPTTASYNNRALAYLKMEKWDKAINDCNTVLNLEKENVKALLRRGTAYKSKNQLTRGKADFEKVLELEPNNKKAESLLEEVMKGLQKEAKIRKEKGRRMVIEEVEEEDNETEEIEIEKPIINGYGNHAEQNDIKQESDDRDDIDVSKTAKVKEEPKCHSSHQKGSNTPPSELSSEREELLEHNSQSSPVKNSSSLLSDKDTKEMCSKNPPETNSLPVSDDRTSAFEKGDSAHQPAAALSSLSSSSPVSETAEKASDSALSSSLSSASSAEVESSSTELTPDNSSEASCPSFTRPVFVQLPLPASVSKLKVEGNNLFRSGQYSSASEIYSKAISHLERDSAQIVNLSLLLSNRAACCLKTGNCSAAISDCERSLALVPHGLKSLLRRAAAYEAIEKYGQAYIDYKHVLSMDSSVDQAFQGATRCQRILQETHGQRSWRDKIPPLKLVQPWEVPLIVDEASPLSSSASSVSAQPMKNEALKSSDASKLKPTQVPKVSSENVKNNEKPKETPSLSKEAQFDKLKALGNAHVQKGEYSEAETCYSSCIALCPEQVVCYTNRALCYIKLKKATEAEADCDKALTLQPDNPKALYRRALARKMLQRYKLSMQDLVELLKLEPKNKAANTEMEIVKQLYKEELEQLKQKKQENDGKVRKRMKIEEVDDEDDEEKPGRTKSQVKSQSKVRGGKSNQPPSVVKSKGNNHAASEKKQSGKESSPSSQGMPAAPLSAPRLMKTTPYEFCQAWNSLKPAQGIQPYAEILRQISPPDLPSVISNKLDGEMLQIIVRCVYEEMVLKGDVDKGYQILDNLCKVPRFSTVSMFLSSKEKKEVSSVLDILGKAGSSAYSKADVLRLKKGYSVK